MQSHKQMPKEVPNTIIPNPPATLMEHPLSAWLGASAQNCNLDHRQTPPGATGRCFEGLEQDEEADGGQEAKKQPPTEGRVDSGCAGKGAGTAEPILMADVPMGPEHTALPRQARARRQSYSASAQSHSAASRNRHQATSQEVWETLEKLTEGTNRHLALFVKGL